MARELDEFMENVVIINKDLSHYEDEAKGIMFYLNTVQLLVQVEARELDEKEYDVAIFKQEIDKETDDFKYNKKMIKRLVSKYSTTKNPKDQYTITSQELSVREVWNVKNALGIKKSFNDKFKALEYARSINEKLIMYFK